MCRVPPIIAGSNEHQPNSPTKNNNTSNRANPITRKGQVLKLEIDLALTADAATIDATGKLNLLGVFDRIAVNRFPARHARLCLVVRFLGWAGDAGKHQLRIRLTDPKNEELMSLDGELAVAPGRESLESGIRVPHVLNLDGLVFKEAGVHNFEIIVDGKHQASLPLTVLGRGPEPAMA